MTALVLAPLGLLLPGILCALAAAPGSADTSRQAQVAWAVCLFVSYAVLVGLAGGSGVSVERRRHQGEVLRAAAPGALAGRAGVPPRLLRRRRAHRAGQRVRAAVRLGTKAGRERSAREAAYLNGTYGLGVPLRQCDNCKEQFSEARARPPVSPGAPRAPRDAGREGPAAVVVDVPVLLAGRDLTGR